MTAISYDTAVDTAPESGLVAIAKAKRVLEWYGSSERFRQLLQTDPQQAMREFPIDMNPEPLRALWDPLYDGPIDPLVAEYRAFVIAKINWRGEVKEECSPTDPRFRTWRKRQIARNLVENGGYDDYIIHTPVAIELTDGCSVGCWFCGVGATKMMESWPYTEENAELWRGVLSVLRDAIGPASKWGFCYWATDPLDNPDYEHFVTDFSDVIGMFPQTTTAQGHKDPPRIRRLLKLSEARGCRVNRFSVLTEPLLRQIHAEYSAEEMLNVEIVAQMAGGTTPKAAAGAFRLLAKDKKRVTEIEEKKLEKFTDTHRQIAAKKDLKMTFATPPQPGTIACVSGFLLNMVKRSVKLISPCRANDRWPLGYIVFDEATFDTAEELREHMDAMMETYMPLTLTAGDPVRLHPELTYERVADGFHLASRMHAFGLIRPDMAPYLHAIGDHIASGQKTAGQIALSALFEHGIPEVNTLGTLAVLLENGVLIDAKGRGEWASAAP
jgi:radical SAM family RiPP maturation amino acid epimerase